MGLPNFFDEKSLLLGTNFTLDLAGDGVDLLAEMAGIGGYDEIVAEASNLDIAGQAVKVMSLRQLIATKQALGRPKDLAALPMLQASWERKKSG